MKKTKHTSKGIKSAAGEGKKGEKTKMKMGGKVMSGKKAYTILAVFMCLSILFSTVTVSAQTVPLTYNYEITQLPASTVYRTVNVTTYTGARALKNIETYVLTYSDTATNKAGASTSFTGLNTITLATSNSPVTYPATVFFSSTQSFKVDTTYTFVSQGQVDSVRFHTNIKYSINPVSQQVNADDSLLDTVYHVFLHLYKIVSPATAPVY